MRSRYYAMPKRGGGTNDRVEVAGVIVDFGEQRSGGSLSLSSVSLVAEAVEAEVAPAGVTVVTRMVGLQLGE